MPRVRQPGGRLTLTLRAWNKPGIKAFESLRMDHKSLVFSSKEAILDYSEHYSGNHATVRRGRQQLYSSADD